MTIKFKIAEYIHFKPKNVRLRLESDGILLYEIALADLEDELLIGRGSDCAWRIPLKDRCVSERHAHVIRQGKHFVFEDLGSRNGSFLFGKRITRKVMRDGDIFSIGDCKLFVRRDDSGIGDAERLYPFHRLEFLSGPQKGSLFDLKEDFTKIGSAGDCQLILNDTMVSHVHAIIENHNDGTCWIKDQGSKNGTLVNKLSLNNITTSSGRMLKDGDIITIAYFDFRFWDRHVQHIRSHGMLKLVAAVATVAVVLSCWALFNLVMPSARDYYLHAEKAASQQDFSSAMEYLKKAEDAHGAELNSDKRQELSRSIVLWSQTVQQWNVIQDLLRAEKWAEAKKRFAQILTNTQDNWRWNSEDALRQMRIAQATQQLLDRYLEARELMKSSSDDFDYLKELLQKLNGSIRECETKKIDFREKLLALARKNSQEIGSLLKEHESLVALMRECVTPDQIPLLREKLSAKRKMLYQNYQRLRSSGLSASDTLVNYCDRLLEPLQHLDQSYQVFLENIGKIAGMDFGHVKNTLPLPPMAQCMVYPSLGTLRTELQQLNGFLPRVITYLKNFKVRFNALDLGPEQRCETLVSLFDEQKLAKALNCDTLELPPPQFTDNKPSGEYDRLFGVHVFYLYISGIENEFDSSVLDDRFVPVLFSARDLFFLLKTYTDFYYLKKSPEIAVIMDYIHKVPAEKNLAERYARHASALLKQRNRFLMKINTLYQQEPVLRKKLMLGGIVSYLADSKLRFVSPELVSELAACYRQLRTEMRRYLARTDETTIRRNERRLLELGLPGDPLIRQAWSEHVKGGKK